MIPGASGYVEINKHWVTATHVSPWSFSCDSTRVDYIINLSMSKNYVKSLHFLIVSIINVPVSHSLEEILTNKVDKEF